MYTIHRPFQYTSQCLYIGASVNFQGFEFLLTDADEFTLNFMETHASEYQMANISSIMSKIKEAIQPVYKEFMCNYIGCSAMQNRRTMPAIEICCDTTAYALRELLGTNITEHEIVTFIRYFSVEKSEKKDPGFSRSIVQSMVQMEIANWLWNDIEGVKERIYDIDPNNHNGFMPLPKLRTIIKSCRLPLKGILIDDMLSV